MSKPVLLDCGCGDGLGAEGYRRAGFYVVGVDRDWHGAYRGDEFIQGDALDFLPRYGHGFDVIHASPDCQGYTELSHIYRNDPAYQERHPRAIPLFREALRRTGRPYVIENVPKARRHMIEPIVLCGADFGLKVYRHRLFESNILLLAMPHVPHKDSTPHAGHGISPKGFVSIAGNGGMMGNITGMTFKEYACMAMGVDWPVSRSALSQGLPPAYTQYIGTQLMRLFQ